MFTVITIVHILSCIFLILVVLLQTGKGADMGAVFGGSSSTVFGSSGAGTFLTRLTTATAVVFMLTSLSLTYFSSQSHSATVFDSAPAASAPDAPPAAAPAAPEAAAPPAAPAPVEAAPEPEANAAPEAAPAAEAPPAQPATN
jgi:preprotein translocase subunit SecG